MDTRRRRQQSREFTSVTRKCVGAGSLTETRSPDKSANLNVYTLAMPSGLTENQRSERLAELTDLVRDVDDVDVFLQALWITN